MRQDLANPAVIVCGNCGADERLLLHHVRHRGLFRRLCTSCILRLHPQSFCPTCFHVYDSHPANDAVTCFKCYSSSHPSCVQTSMSSKNPYICPSCVNPNVPILAFARAKELGKGSCKMIDLKASKVILAAARIAAVSMGKASAAARMEAERRAKEAAITRKRAREALDYIVFLMAKEKKTQSGVAGRSVGVVVSATKVAVDSGVGKNEKVDTSKKVLAALNAVELKERERLQSFEDVSAAVPEEHINGVAMEVEGNKKVDNSPPSSSENLEGSDDSGSLDTNRGGEMEKLSNGLPEIPLANQPQPVVDQTQPMESRHDTQGNAGS